LNVKVIVKDLKDFSRIKCNIGKDEFGKKLKFIICHLTNIMTEREFSKIKGFMQKTFQKQRRKVLEERLNIGQAKCYITLYKNNRGIVP